MKTINISFAESEATSDSDTLGLQVTAISSNQDTEDAAGSCGPEKAAGDDWSFSNAVVTGTAGDDVDPVTTSVQVAAERCGGIKSARVYTIDVTCTDEGGTDSVPLTVTVAHDHGKKH